MPTSIDLLSVISGIQVTSDDILQSELLLSQVLTANDPTLDIRTGTAIRDLCIRPNATLLATINKALIYYWSQNSLLNATDTTPTIFVDEILHNFFMTRFTGTETVINVNLYFAKQTNVTLTTDLSFSTDNVSNYYPLVAATYGASQLTYDPSSNQWYLSVNLIAGSTGTAYNISSGSLIYFSNFNPFFLHAEINYLSALATDTETNTQFIARAQNTISTRNLINTPSIKSNLLVAFPIIANVYSVGMGDPEMIRDLNQVVPPAIGYPIWIHVGGCTDIYVKVPTVSALLQFTTDVNGNISLTGAIFKTNISSIAGGPNTDTIPVSTPYTTTNANIIINTPTQLLGLGTIIQCTSRSNGLTIGERFIISGANQYQFNGTFQVATIIDNNNFTYLAPIPINTTATGIFSLTLVNRTNDVGFSTRQTEIINFSQAIKSITSGGVSWAAGIVTVTCPAHGYSNNDMITLAGLSAYNGIWGITVVSIDIFTFATATNNNTVISTGATAQKVYGGQSVSMEVFYHQDIDGIQTYLTDSNNRVLASDQLARGFNLCMLDISIVGYGILAPDQAISSVVVTKYLDSLSPGQPFIMADLLSSLYTAGITTIQTPLAITYIKYWRDLFPPTYGSISDALNPKDITNIFGLNSLITSVISL